GAVTASMLVTLNGAGAKASHMNYAESAATIDVGALLTAANGAPPLICALAAQSVRGYGWGGDWTDAPVTPLSSVAPSIRTNREFNDSKLPQADIDRLLTGLAATDPCVRELSVRMLGGQKNDGV